MTDWLLGIATQTGFRRIWNGEAQMTHLNVVALTDCVKHGRSVGNATLLNSLTDASCAIELAITLRYLKKQPTHRLSRCLAAWNAPKQYKAAE